MKKYFYNPHSRVGGQAEPGLHHGQGGLRDVEGGQRAVRLPHARHGEPYHI